MEEEYS